MKKLERMEFHRTVQQFSSNNFWKDKTFRWMLQFHRPWPFSPLKLKKKKRATYTLMHFFYFHPSLKFDSQNRIFIDRDPALFKVILYFLRTRRISYPNDTDLNDLLHEVEFFGISEMSNRIRPCLATKKEICGGIIFSEMLQRAEVTNDPVSTCCLIDFGVTLNSSINNKQFYFQFKFYPFLRASFNEP